MKTLVVVGSIALIAAVVVGVWAIRYYTADTRGAIAANERIRSGPLRLSAYNQFFNQCASIQGLEAQIEALKVEQGNATESRDLSRINASITGVTASRARAIAQYNADARKDYTIGQFRDSDLPFRINVGEDSTQCGNF